MKLCPFLQQPTPHTSLEIFLQKELTIKEASEELSQMVIYEENVLFYRLLLCAGR